MTLETTTNGDANVSSTPSLKLEAKRVKLRWDDDAGEYVARDDDPKPEVSKEVDPFAISVVRRFVPCGRNHNVVEEIHLHSPFIIELVKSVMKGNRGMNWKADPIKLDPNTLLAYMVLFRESLQSLEEPALKHCAFFIEFLEKEYRTRLQELERLKSAQEITWNWVPGLLLPGDILFTRCAVSGDPRAVRLVSMEAAEASSSYPRHFALTVEYVNVQSCRPGLGEDVVRIPQFVGVKHIRDLSAFPLRLHAEYEGQRASLIERGKWHWELVREKFRHMHYNAVAYRHKDDQYRKVFVKSRVMVDQEMYDIHHPSCWTPSHSCDLDGEEMKGDSRTTLTDEEYLMFSALVYGYSLSDREWLDFRVSDIQHIEWNPKIFDSLELDPETKYMIRALIETQSSEDMKFDDFILGKGKGLIFNLHGSPGVGKTLTAEATSEVTRSPLYMTGAGDLGTNASDLDTALSKLAALAERWRAVVLIDEADVFLEKRESRDVQRNALVAVFLRQLEYYSGILFLTTNRVEVFDEAMQSRIHITLHYQALSLHARERLWAAFFAKAANPLEPTPEQYKLLRELELNGREIKNIVKVASTFAAYEKRAMVFEDISRSLKILKHAHA